MDVTNSDTNFNKNPEYSDNISLSKSISTIMSIVKETMKKIKQIDTQVRKLTKDIPKDITPVSGVEYCIAASYIWAPIPLSKFTMTISCCRKSTQYCLTDID